MKATIELPDELIKQARRVIRQEETSLRALIEEGLRRSLEARRQTARQPLDFPSYDSNGLTDEFQSVPCGTRWSLQGSGA